MSEQEAMISRSAEMLCRNVLEFGDMSVVGLLDVMQSACFDLSVFKGMLRRARDCQELAQREGD